MNLNKNR